MLDDPFLGGIFALLICCYIAWRKNAAVNAKIELADEVNKFLGSNFHPENVKLNIYAAWEDSSRYIFMFKFLRAMLASKGKKTSTYKEMTDEEKDALLVVLKIVWVNARLMPVTYFLLLICFFFKVVMSKSINRVVNRFKANASDYLHHAH
jgi:hypothetical protein